MRQRLRLGLASLLCAIAVPANAEDFQINISKIQDLNFGSMLVVSSGTVSLDSRSGDINGSAHVVRPASLQGSTTGPAKFQLTCSQKSSGNGRGGGRGGGGHGDNNDDGELKYRLNLVDLPDEIEMSGRRSPSMDLDDFEMYSSLESRQKNLSKEREIKVRNCRSYSETISVGAMLRVGNSQRPGRYTNDLTLQVRYEYDD